MQPLSVSTRRAYFVTLLVLFAVVVPLTVLYATGYRLSDLSLSETGGAFVSVPLSETVVSLNGSEAGTSGIFDKTIYVDDLSPGTYVLQAVKEGYYPWSKTITVEPWIVTDAVAVLVPTVLEFREVTTSASAATSTTQQVTAATYRDLRAAFATTTPTTSTTTPIQAAGGIGLFIQNGDVSVRWMRSESSTASAFCIKPSNCVKEFRVEKGKEEAADARFFGGGVVYQVPSGIYFADVDIRSPQLTLPLYTRSGTEFRVVNGTLYIKDGVTYYQLEAW